MATEQDKLIAQLTEQVEYYKNLSHCLSGWRMDDARLFCELQAEMFKSKSKLYEEIIELNRVVDIYKTLLVELTRGN